MAVTGTSLFQGLYLGEYDHALDAQCRVTLPSDWRNPEGATELVMIPARGKALVQRGGGRTQLLVAHSAVFVGKGFYLFDDRSDLAYLTVAV